ncbi:CubicO group peptidase, beta-lactamase class C family [Marivirga sericea]|uniref:CubicO group peptidase, beta-lactamase class C family n=1 Tax=Marivirga sericea TaxID=1028 RepID=A0A1X7JNA0_9BACT|nr:serine hydrolase domain-containing protein [Marivirga sericea]SMG28915.1 CubicO group peptidase, beta-lactamase class C family [Marivirga sericea]
MKAIQLIILLVLQITICQSQNLISNQPIKKEIDDYVFQLMDDYEITGAAVAIIKEDKVLHQNFYGYANKEFNVPVSENTLFKLHSVTKPIVSTAIFELIEEGKISLSNSIAEYFDVDEKYSFIKVSHLLAHSSGLREIEKNRNTKEEDNKNLVFQTELQFKPGEQFQYAATNYWLLQKIVEKVTNQKFQDYIVNQYFGGLNAEVVFSADILEVVPNRTFEYYPNKSQKLEIFEWYLPEYSHAAGGLNLTLNSLISWCQKLNDNRLINQNTKAKMWEQYPYRNDNTGRSYGWEINTVNGLKSYGHDGGGISYLQVIPQQDLTVIFLSNGYKQKYISFNVATTLACMIDKELNDPFIFAYQKLDAAFIKKGDKDILKLISQLKTNVKYRHINYEDLVNRLGYQRLYYYEFPRYQDAIRIFKFNTRENPKNWNGYDSLGEAYENYGDIENAIKNYQIAINLNKYNEQSNNDRLEKIIKNLKQRQ